jgi:hypothetical protein
MTAGLCEETGGVVQLVVGGTLAMAGLERGRVDVLVEHLLVLDGGRGDLGLVGRHGAGGDDVWGGEKCCDL